MSAPAAPAVAPVGQRAGGVEIGERRAWSVSGWFGVLAAAVCGYLTWLVLGTSHAGWAVLPVLAGVIIVLSLAVVPPGQTRVVLFFGRYVGTRRTPGFATLLPLNTRRAVSVRARNFETSRLKVNDADGNPVEIAAIVVWRVADTARAVFAVDDYVDFVRVQAESALRHVATTHPYDAAGHPYDATGHPYDATGHPYDATGHPYDATTHPDDSSAGADLSLRGSTDVVASELADEVAQRVAVAGVDIVEVRISHLAYASEIAQAMLRRQQANAVVAARTRIVEGAVGMVELALARLNDRDIVDLDEERKAAMVSNLMVVLCGDQPASPIVNTGSLYS